MAGLGLFGLGSTRSRSSSSSSSQSSGYSVSGSSDTVFGADLFKELFGGASAAGAGINTDALTTTANRLFDSGAGFIDELAELSGEGGGGPGIGESALIDQLGGSDGLLEEQIGALQSDLSEFFNEGVLPGLRSDAIAVGGMDNNRRGIAEGIAGRDLLRTFSQGALSLRQGAQDRKTALATSLAGLEQQRTVATMQRRLQAAGAGLAAIPGQFDLAEAGSMAALSPFMALAQILGDPTVLTDAFARGEEQSSSSSQSSGSTRGFQFNLGAA